MLDRFALWVMRSLSITMLLGGASVFIAAVPLLALPSGSGVPRTLARTIFEIGGIFVAGGLAGRYLARAQDRWFHNEVREISDSERPAVGGWLGALAVVLVALPIAALLRLRPFLAEWQFVLGLLDGANIWDGGAGRGPAGMVLLPIFAGLTPPALELAALTAFPIASAALLLLMLSRHVRFPRAYVLGAILMAALVLASLRGAAGVRVLSVWAGELITRSSPRPQEDAELRSGLARYTAAVSSTAPVLVWTVCGYLVWLPGMFLSRRVHETFAHRADSRVASPFRSTDLSGVGRPDVP